MFKRPHTVKSTFQTPDPPLLPSFVMDTTKEGGVYRLVTSFVIY